MDTNYTWKLPETMIEDAKRVNLVELASRYTALRRETPTEFSGSCPKCGGADRFHCTATWFFCRQCHSERADAIGFLRWLTPGLTFADAVLRLTGGASMPALPARPQARPQAPQAALQPAQDGVWKRKARELVDAAHDRLCWQPDGAPGREYLLRRGIKPVTWVAFGIGFRLDVPVPGTAGKRRAPAIVLPWQTAQGNVYGIRYRFLEPQDGHKITSERLSDFTGRFYGDVLPPESRTLVLREGEINAMSIAQVFPKLDVRSIGSESATLSAAQVDWVNRFQEVILWVDKPAKARSLLSALPRAHAIATAQDANDMLQAGTLGAFLAAARYEACKGNQAALHRLVRDLQEGTSDSGAAHVARHLESILTSGQ